MQKVINAQIIRKISSILVLILYSFSCFSQEKRMQPSDDYTLMDKAIERYFESRNFSDSLFFNSEFYKENAKNIKIKREVDLRKELDTIYIKSIGDKFYYGRFLKKDARWKREKRYKKIKPYLDSIFSETEVANYKKQLEDNNYFWNEDKIDNKDRVFVINDLVHTREEISKMSKVSKDSLLRENSKLTKSKNVYTFSKPIFSINKKLGLITYSNIANNVLLIYEKRDNDWQFKNIISEYYFIDRIEER